MKSRRKFYLTRVRCTEELGLLLLALTALLAALTAFQHLYPSQQAWFDWGCVTLIPASFLLYRRRGMIAAARRLDYIFNARNVVETSCELESSRHPLRGVVAARAEAVCRTYQLPWKYRLLPLLLSLFIAACLTAAAPQLLPAKGKLETFAATPADASPAPDSPRETARLAITRPEPEIRAKPLDELDWEGAGLSPRGFSTLVLAVLVNGRAAKELLPDERPGKGGEIRFKGFLALEELEVKPFDLVSFHLAGTAELDGAEKRILSLPQFIEVRPFREDAFLDRQGMPIGSGDPAIDAYAQIQLLLQTQIELNKALFSVRIRQEMESPEFEKELRQVKDSQKELAAELDAFLAAPDTRRIPADAVNHLELALAAMRKIETEYRLPEMSEYQQTAVREFIQALKSTRKVLAQKGENSPPPPPEIFKDPQEFTLPPRKENPAEQLKDLIAAEEKIIKAAKEESADPSQLAEEQRKLAEEAAKTAQKLDQDGRDSLSRAAEAMKESAGMLESGKKTHGSLAAQKAAAELKQTLRDQEAKSDRAMRETLTAALEKLTGQKPTAEMLRELADDLQKSAFMQQCSGRCENAEALSRAAGEAGKAAKDPAAGSEALQNELERLLRMGRDSRDMLEAAAKSLRELNDQLKYYSKHPKTAGKEEFAAWNTEMKQSLIEAKLALADLERSGGGTEELQRAAEALRKTQSLYSKMAEQGRFAPGPASDSLHAGAVEFLEAAERMLRTIRVTGSAYVFHPDDVPERYRKAVGDYFKRLSEKEREVKP